MSAVCSHVRLIVIDLESWSWIFSEKKVLVTRAKDIIRVVVVMADVVIELDIAQIFDVIWVMEHDIPHLPYLIVDRPE